MVNGPISSLRLPPASKKKKKKNQPLLLPAGRPPRTTAKMLLARSLPATCSCATPRGAFKSFASALLEALFQFGVVAPQLEAFLDQLVNAFDLRGALYVTPTGLFLSLWASQAPPQEQQQQQDVHFIRIKSIGLDVMKVNLLEQVLEDVLNKRLSLAEATERVHSIVTSVPRSPSLDHLADVVASAFGSAAIAVLFNGGWREVLATGFVGLVLGIAQVLLSVLRDRFNSGSTGVTNSAILEPTLSFLGTLFAHLAHRWLHHLSLFIVALGGIIMLVPGFTLTVGIIELTARNLVCGSARLASAILSLMLLAFGIVTGTRLATATLGRQVDVEAQSLPAWLVIPATFVASVAFGITMRIRWQPKLWTIVLLCSAVAVATTKYGERVFGESATAFVGALAVSLLTNVYAKIFRDGKAVAATMISITLLVPGSLGVRGLTALFQGFTDEGIRFVASMFVIGLQIAVGVTVGNLFVPVHVLSLRPRHNS